MIDHVPPSDENPTIEDLNRDLLREYLHSTHKVAGRFSWSLDRVGRVMPLEATKVDELTDEDEEMLDAFLYRFNSLTAMIQDHITRALLKVEEEYNRELSRKDQRLVMEKLGALPSSLDFGTIAELRNKIAHTYPDESEKQAEILNAVFASGEQLLEGYNGVLSYADEKHFNSDIGLAAVPRTASEHPTP